MCHHHKDVKTISGSKKVTEGTSLFLFVLSPSALTSDYLCPNVHFWQRQGTSFRSPDCSPGQKHDELESDNAGRASPEAARELGPGALADSCQVKPPSPREERQFPGWPQPGLADGAAAAWISLPPEDSRDALPGP